MVASNGVTSQILNYDLLANFETKHFRMRYRPGVQVAKKNISMICLDHNKHIFVVLILFIFGYQSQYASHASSNLSSQRNERLVGSFLREKFKGSKWIYLHYVRYSMPFRPSNPFCRAGTKGFPRIQQQLRPSYDLDVKKTDCRLALYFWIHQGLKKNTHKPIF